MSTITRCPHCNGRTAKTELGSKCIKSTCEGAQGIFDPGNDTQFLCACGETMNYIGLTQLGEPKYHCQACGNLTKM